MSAGLATMGGLGLSLKLPPWARSAAEKLLAGASVTVQTPAGPVTLRGNDRNTLQKLQDLAGNLASSASVRFGPEPESWIDRVPGGKTTLYAVAGVLAFLLLRPMLLPARRSNPRRRRVRGR